MEQPFIDYGSLTDHFKNHLDADGNSNILFSGKFGSGKSTFVRKFFEAHEDEYLAIHLYPVNYAVNSNEDVFELIKVDIIKQLFEKGVLKTDQPKTQKGKEWEAIKALAKKDPLRLTALIAKIAAQLHPYGAALSGITNSVYDLIREIDNYEKAYNENFVKTDAERADDHLLNYLNRKGTYLEYDHITYLINHSLDSVKDKRTVLVLDDLDRLDPEHIFRIMNVLAAHTDVTNGKHKFGFDSVILIAHYQNLKSIFHHKYGSKTDFLGYIGKFHSSEIFEFDIYEHIIREINAYSNALFLDKSEQEVFSFLCSSLVNSGYLKIRDIEKLLTIKYEFKPEVLFCCEKKHMSIGYSVNYIDFLRIHSFAVTFQDLPIVRMFLILTKLFGKKTLLDDAIKVLERVSIENDSIKQSFIRIMALPLRIKRTHPNNSAIFYNSIDGSQFIQSSPQINLDCFGCHVIINPKWSSVYHYDGSQRYFEGCEIRITNLEKFNQHVFRTELLNLYQFLMNQSFMVNLGLVSK